MSFRLIEKSVTTSPEFKGKMALDSLDNVTHGISKIPTGQKVEQTHYVWRCSCGALAVTGYESPPSSCGKCHEGER